MTAELTANTRLLIATERRDRIDDVVAIDPDGTSLQPARNLVCATDVVGPDRSGETIGRVIALQDRIVLVLERDYRHDGSEDLFASDLHVVLNIGEDGRIHEVTLAFAYIAARSNLGAFLLTDFQV